MLTFSFQNLCDRVGIDFTFLGQGASLHVAVTAHTPAFQLITVMSVTRGETAPFHEQYLDSEHYDCQSEHQRRKAYVE